MNTLIKEITSKTIWNDFYEKTSPDTFLHMWEWSEFQKKDGNKIFHLGIFENNKLCGIAFIIKIIAKRGTFLFCPHGPHIENNNENHFQKLINYLKNLAKKEKASFIRFSPTHLKTEENIKLFKKLGFKKAPMHMHSELTWILDIKEEDKKLLKNMRSVHRYSIRRSIKEGVKVWSTSEKKNLEKFYSIYKETVSRQKFSPFSKKYFENEFDCFSQNDSVRLFFAEYNNEIIATAFIIFSKHSAFYHHGASLLKYRKIPAAYLLQWEVIQEAKKRGCEKYNFWGIAPKNKKNHPWKGLTFFKTGFGGEAHPFMRAQDLVLGWRYWVNWIVETVRRVRRGY